MLASGLWRQARAWWLALGLGVGLVAGRAEAFEPRTPPEVAHWFAADTVVYLEVAQPTRLIDRASDHRLTSVLGTIPSVHKALEGEQVRKLKAVADLIADKLGTTPEAALRDLTGGGLVLAVEAEPGKKPAAFLVVTPDDPKILKTFSATLVDLARQDAAGKGQPDPVKTVEYRGLTGYLVGNAGYAIIKDRLLITNQAEAGKAVIDRALDGPPGTLADDPAWKARRAEVKTDALAWGFARLERLRELDPKRFGGASDKPKPPPTLLVGGWIEAIRKAPWVSASLTWTEDRLAADLQLPVAQGGRDAAFKGFFPPKESGAAIPITVPGMVASVSLWRDLTALWDARADLLRPEDVQNLAKLDTLAGQFFGGRDFGTGVLGALGDEWRLVVALQDETRLNPVPDVKLPAFALIAELKPDDDDFAQRLKVAFQSFIGLANLGAAQTKAPPLELGSETFEGVTIATSHFMPAKARPGDDAKAPVHQRHNFSPSAAQVGNYFLISSSQVLARDLVKALKTPAKAGEATLLAEADGDALARLIERNRNRLAMQNMLEKGHDKDQAEAEIEFLATLLRYFGHGRLSVRDGSDATQVGLDFTLGR